MEKEFDFENTPWTIDIGSEEEYIAVNDWLFEKTGKRYESKYKIDERHIVRLTNTFDGNEKPTKSGTILCSSYHFVNTGDFVDHTKKIKFKFQKKVTIADVTYPEVETPEQKEIAAIEIEMRKLADRLEKLKGN